MKIVFECNHKYWGGFSPNGGSRTIILSAEELRKQGHTVDLVGKDKFTWFGHPKTLMRTPKADALVAVSISDVISVMKNKQDCQKAYWARPLERWQTAPELAYHILRKFTRRGGKIFSNSKWQRDKFMRHGIPTQLQYAGLDFDRWEDKRAPRAFIGGLYNKSHKSKRTDLCNKAMDEMGEKFLMLGKTIKNPTHEEIVAFYNKCLIWFAPVEREGFHNCPAEANLCGALVVCNREKKNGMDYATDETAMRYNTFEEAIECLRNPDLSKIEKMQKYIRKHIGSRKDNMEEFAEALR